MVLTRRSTVLGEGEGIRIKTALDFEELSRLEKVRSLSWHQGIRIRNFATRSGRSVMRNC